MILLLAQLKFEVYEKYNNSHVKGYFEYLEILKQSV